MLNNGLGQMRQQLFATKNRRRRGRGLSAHRLRLDVVALEQRILLNSDILAYSIPATSIGSTQYSAVNVSAVTKATASNWMGQLDGSIPLTDISMPGTYESASGPSLAGAFFGDSNSDVLGGPPTAIAYAALGTGYAAALGDLAAAIAPSNAIANGAAVATTTAALATYVAAGLSPDASSYLSLAADSAGVVAAGAQALNAAKLIGDAVTAGAAATASTAAATADGNAASEYTAFANYIENNISSLDGGDPNNKAMLTTLENLAIAEATAHSLAAAADTAAATASGALAVAAAKVTADEAAEAAEAADEAGALAAEPELDAAEAAADTVEASSAAADTAADATAAALDIAAAAELGLDPAVDVAAAVADGVAAAADAELTAATVADVAATAAATADTADVAADAAAEAADAAALTSAEATEKSLQTAATVAGYADIAAVVLAITADTTFTAQLQKDYATLNSVQAQSLGITDQLNAGIRSLDIRGTLVNSTIEINNGQYYTGLTLQNVLNDCTAFLQANPSETIVMSLSSNENPQGPVNSSNSFNTDLNALLNSTDTAVTGNQTYNDFIYYSSSPTTTPDLGQVRGKIVIIPNAAQWQPTPEASGQTLGWEPTEVADDAITVTDPATQWNDAENFSSATGNSGLISADLGNPDTLYRTDLSAGGATNTTLFDAAGQVNTLAAEYLANFDFTRTTGIVGIDTTGMTGAGGDDELIDEIIDENNLPIMISSPTAAAADLVAAINQANSRPGVNTIEFDNVSYIVLQANLPIITCDLDIDPVTINNTTNGTYQALQNSTYQDVTEVDFVASPGMSAVTESPSQYSPPVFVNDSDVTIANQTDFEVDVATDSKAGTGATLVGDLRYCVQSADGAVAGGDPATITFASGLGTITLEYGPLQLTASSANATTTIQGGGLITISGGGTTNAFQVDAGAQVSLTGLSIIDGNSSGNGGGLNNSGTATLSDCTLTGNKAAAFGGGVYSGSGTITMTDCTISGNSAGHGGGLLIDKGTATLKYCAIDSNTVSGKGGALDNYGGTTTLEDCTISGNSASNGAGGIIAGLNHSQQPTTNLYDTTLAENSATTGAGGLYNQGVARLENTIVAGNTSNGTPSDIVGSFTDDGYNLLGTALKPGVSTDVFSNAPGLAPLANLGGPTETMALESGSPALGAGDPSASNLPVYDQRGFSRVVNGKIDIGAYETQVPVVLTVVSNTDTGTGVGLAGDLRYCIAQANAEVADGISAVINFSPGLDGQTITLQNGPLGLMAGVVNATTTIQGGGQITISGDGTAGVFQVEGGAQVTLTGLTITDGGGSGGGITNLGTLTVSDCIISGNTTSGNGGGLDNSVLATATLSDCTLTGNTAAAFGGGVYSGPVSTTTLTDCTVSGNSAGHGGGLLIDEGTATLKYCAIYSNSVTSKGGGLDNYGGTTTLEDCTISGNSATNGGAGIIAGSKQSQQPTTHLYDTTLADNSATSGVGGLYNEGVARLENTIIAGNTTGSPSTPSDIGGSAASSVTGSYNLIGTGGSGGVANTGGNTGNLLDVANPGLAALANNGGPTETMALESGSPALGAGNPSAPNLPATDQRGEPRTTGKTLDIGAYEHLPIAYAESLDANGNLSITQELPGASDNLTFSISDGNYTFTDSGDNGFDQPTGAQAGLISGALGRSISVPSADVESISVVLGTGTNVFTFAGSGGADVAPITVNTGTATGDEVNVTGAVLEGGSITLTSNTISLSDASSSLTSSGSGAISLTAAQNITLSSGSSISTSSGNVTLLANSGGTATGNFIGINVSGTIESTGGNVSLTGTGGNNSGGAQYGVEIENGGTVETASGSTGTVSVTGTGGGGSGSVGHDYGVYVAAGGTVTSGGGTVTIEGTSGNSSGSGETAVIADGLVTSGGGDVSVIGNSLGTGTGNAGKGVYVGSTGEITAGGTGTVSVTGTGGAGSGGTNVGIVVSGGTVTSGGGTIALDGTGGGTGSDDCGIDIEAGGTVTAAGSGDLTLTGTAAAANTAAITTTGGIFASGNGTLTTGSGTLTLTGDVIDLGGSSSVSTTGAGQLLFQAETASRPIILGGSDTAGSLVFTSADLTAIDSSFSLITIGSASGSGAITTANSALAFTTNIALQTPGGSISQSAGITAPVLSANARTGITLSNSANAISSFSAVNSTSGAISLTNAGPIAITGIAQNGTATGSNVTVTVTNDGSLTISGPITTTAAGNGAVSLTASGGEVIGASLSAGGSGNVTLTANSAGTATGNFIGINVNAVKIQSATGSVTLQGTGGNDSGGSQFGVLVQAGGCVQTTGGSGTVTIQGTGGASVGGNNDGVYVTGTGSLVTSGGGAVAVTGVGGGSGSAGSLGGNYGVCINGAMVSSGGGNVAVTGSGGASLGGGDAGVALEDATVTSAGSGTVTIHGTGGTNVGNNNDGIDEFGGSIVTSGGGNVIVTGQGGGSGACGSDQGVFIGGTVTSTGSGTVNVTGTGGAGGDGFNLGVYVDGKGSLVSSGGGAVTIIGTGGSGSENSDASEAGVSLAGGTVTSGGSGSVTIQGTGGAEGGPFNDGIDEYAGAIVTSGGGNVSLTGYGGGAGGQGNDQGIFIAATVTSGGGAVSVTGTGGAGSGGFDLGVWVYAGGKVTAEGSGTVLVTGTGGTGSGGADYGVFMTGATASAPGSLVSSGGGAVTLTGTGGSGSSGVASQYSSDAGVVLAGGNVTSGGSGTVTIRGTGGDAVGITNDGIDESGGSIVTSGGGNVFLIGQGGGPSAGGSDEGIYIAATVTSGGGTVSVTGTGGAGSGGGDAGVWVNTGGTVTAGGNGTVTVNGTAGSGSGGGTGVWVNDGSTVTASGSGAVSVTGTGGTGSGDDLGVYVSGTGSLVSSGGGAVSVTGTGGAGSGDVDYGVWLNAGGMVTSGGSGTVSVTGTGGTGSGGDNFGVEVDTGSAVTSGGSGAVTVTGTGGSGSPGVATQYSSDAGVVLQGGNVTSGGSGTVTIQGTGGDAVGITNDGIDESGGSIVTSGDGNVFLIGQGGGPSAGGSDEGIFIAATVTSGGGTVSLTGTGGAGSGGDDFGVWVDAGGTVTAGGSGTVSVTGTGGAGSGQNNFGMLIDGSVTSGGNGAVQLEGTGGANGSSDGGVYIQAGGTVSSGGSGAVTVSGWGYGNGNNAVEVDGTVTSGGGNVTVTGLAGAGTGGEWGVFVYNGGSVTAGGSGTVTIHGTGGADAGGQDIGVVVAGSGSSITSGGGAISVTGTGAGTGSLNFGIDVEDAGAVTAVGSATLTLTGTASPANTATAAINTSGTAVEGSTGGTLATGSGELTLIGDVIDLGVANSVSTTGAAQLLFEPQTAGRPTLLGGSDTAGNLVFTSTDLAAIAPGFSQIAIGSASNVTVNASQTATFTVPSPNLPGTDIQWQVNMNDGHGFNNIAGATGTTLSVGNVTPAQNGYQYRAVFSKTGYAGLLTTSAATLTVVNYLVLPTTVGDQYVVTPSSGNTSLNVTLGGNPVATITSGGGYITFVGTGGTVTIYGESGPESTDVFTIGNTSVVFNAADGFNGTTIDFSGTGITRNVDAQGSTDTFNILGNGANGPSGSLIGGGGTNAFVFGGSSKLIGAIQGAGSSTLNYSGYGSGVNVNLGTGANGTATGITGAVSGITAIVGSNFNDTLNAGTVPNVVLTGGLGTNTLSGTGAGDSVVESLASSYTLTNTKLTGTSPTFTDNLSGITIANLTGSSPTTDSFTVSGWTGSGSLSAPAGSTASVTDSAVGSFTLSNSQLTAPNTTLNLSGITAANLTDSSTTGGNTFNLTGWTGGGTLKGKSETLIESTSSSVTLANASLTLTGGPSLSLSGFTTANLTDTAGGNTFTVSGWTGSGTLTNSGSSPDTIAASKSAGYTLTNASLASTDKMSLDLIGFGTADLAATSTGKTFTITGWTGAGTLTGTGTGDTVIDSDNGSFTLTNTQLTAPSTTLSLTDITTADLTDSSASGGNTFTVSGWTGKGTLTGNQETLVDTVTANTTLTNTALAVTGLPSLTLSGFAAADVTDTAGGNTFTLSGWTGSGSLTDTGTTGDTVAASSIGGYTLSNASLQSTASSLSLALSGITTANLTDSSTAGGNTFTVTGWTGGGTLRGKLETLVDSVASSVTLANASLAVAGGASLTLSGFTTANLTDTAGSNTFTVSAWTGSGSLADSASAGDTVAATKSAGYTLMNSSLSSTDKMSLNLNGITTANLTATASGKTFTVSGWTGAGMLSDTATTGDTVADSAAGSFTLTNLFLTAPNTTLGLNNITAANLTDTGSGGNSFTIISWTGKGTLTGPSDTLVDSVASNVTLTNTALAVTLLPSLTLSGFAAADLTDTVGGNTFTVSGWTGSGSLTDTGTTGDTVAASSIGGYTLSNASLQSTASSLSLALSGITTANLTDSSTVGGNTFTITGWTGGGTLRGKSETLVDSVANSVTLANASLAVAGGASLTLSGFTTANLTDTAGSNTFTVSAWTGSGSLADSASAGDTVAATKNAGYTLMNSSLSSTDKMSLSLSGITAANLAATSASKTFTVSGWAGGGSLTDTATGVVIASKNAGFVLTNTNLTSTDAMALSLSGITTADLTTTATSGTPSYIVDASAFTGVTNLTTGGTVNAIVYGGSGSGSTLSATGSGNVVLIGGGPKAVLSDTGTGYNILIGGPGTDTVTGNGNDILISGTTSYDSDTSANIAALDAILAEWSSGDSYSTRVNLITSGITVGSTTVGLSSTTCQSNGVANTVKDGASPTENNWFIVNSKDKVTKQSNEMETIV